MLNESTVLNYIKTKLATPFIPLELTDEQILSIVRMETIPFFSRYIPDIKELTIDTTDDNVKTDVDNEYLILDPDGLPIINVARIYVDSGGLIVAGHPVVGMMGGDYESVVKYVLDVEQSMTTHQLGLFNYTIEWIKPNKIRIIPKYTGKFMIKYEREHKPDFSTIPTEFKTHFLNLAYADVAKQIAKIRSQFREFQTPFGPVELNPEKYEEEAREIYDRFVEEMKNYNFEILIDRGTI